MQRAEAGLLHGIKTQKRQSTMLERGRERGKKRCRDRDRHRDRETEWDVFETPLTTCINQNSHSSFLGEEQLKGGQEEQESLFVSQ